MGASSPDGPSLPPTRVDIDAPVASDAAAPTVSGVVASVKPPRAAPGAPPGAHTVAAQGAWRSMAERQDLAHVAAFYRRAFVPALLAWLVWVPFDALLAWGMYPGTFARSLAIRVGCMAGMGAALLGLVRARSYERMLASLLLLALFVNGGIAAVATRLGGLASPYHPGSLVVLAVLGFSPLPWQRVAPVALAAWAVYPAVILGYALRDPGQSRELQRHLALVPLEASAVVGLIVVVMACIGAGLSWALRQQVFESRSIGRYQLRRRLGAGGMGEVWAAWHRSLQREVALKILRAADDAGQAAARFEREVRAMTELTHPNTVRVFDYGTTEDGLTYYAMELLQGENLVELVAREGPLPPERAVHLVGQAARALAEAHARGIVHRDVKPENLFVTDAGGERDFVKVLDFGIALREAERGEAGLTRTGAIAGTPAYIAPEVVRGEAATARADVYALGAVLYFLLTGRAPFESESLVAMLLAHVNEPVAPPSTLAPHPIAADVEALALGCLAKEPGRRPADAAELADALARSSLANRWNPSLSVAPPRRAGPAPAADVAMAPTMEVPRSP